MKFNGCLGLLVSLTGINSQNLRSLSSVRKLQSDDVFVAQDGLVIMEAESVPIVEPWKLESEVPGYTGAGYLRFDGNTISSGNPLGTLSYKFEIDTPGTYHLRMRARKNNTESATTSNDCYTKLVGHPGFRGENVRAALGGMVKVNVWGTRLDHMYGSPLTIETPTYELTSPGTYELQVSGRTKHFVIDRVILYHVGLVTDFYAREAARSESPRRSGGTVSPLPAPVAPPTEASVSLPDAATIESLDLVVAGIQAAVVLAKLEDGVVLDQSVVGTSLSVLAAISGEVDSVTFEYDGITWKEGLVPYAMGGNAGSNNFGVDYLATAGSKSLTVKARYGGRVVDTVTVNFDIVETVDVSVTPGPVATSTPEPSPVAAPVTSSPVPAPIDVPQLPVIYFDLMTARLKVDTVIQALNSGDGVNRAETGTYVSIRASSPEVPVISKITFRYGNIGHTESVSPYMMAGDNGSGRNTPVNYLKTTGMKSVSAKVYNGDGAVVAEQSIEFEIIDA